MIRTRVNKSEFSNIVQKYQNGMSLCALEREYPTNREILKRIIRSYSVEIRDHSHKSRKYTLNENYFDSNMNANKSLVA